MSLDDLIEEIDFSTIPMSKDEFKEWYENHAEEVKDARELWLDLDTQVVSAVENPSHDSAFVALKSVESEGVQNTGTKMLKEMDDEKQIAYAPAMVPNQQDKDGDIVPDKIVEHSAHEFLKELRNDEIDADHETPISFDNASKNRGTVVESWTLDESEEMETVDGEIKTYPKGTWMLAVKFKDETWDRIKSGEITGYSIMGQPTVIETKSEGQTFNNPQKDNTNMSNEIEDLLQDLQEDVSAVKDNTEKTLKDTLEGSDYDVKEYVYKGEEKEDPCWDGYEMVGTDEDGNPRCVPKEEAQEEEDVEEDAEKEDLDDMLYMLEDELGVEYDVIRDALSDLLEGEGSDEDPEEDVEEDAEKLCEHGNEEESCPECKEEMETEESEDSEDEKVEEEETEKSVEDHYEEIVRKVSTVKQDSEDAEKDESDEDEDPYENILD